MKYTIDLTMVAFFLTIAVLFIAMAFAPSGSVPKESSADHVCAKNNGVPIYDTWTGKMTDCKIYLQK